MHNEADKNHLGPVCKCASSKLFMLMLSDTFANKIWQALFEIQRACCALLVAMVATRIIMGQDKQQVLHWQQQSQSDFELPVAIVRYGCAHSLQATTQGEKPSCCCKMRCHQMGMACQLVTTAHQLD